ncbi:amidohydrolase family protein [Nocardioides marmoribigeumensis]|uniref:Cytosine/adenosine deaminase-related metal-dependent hydrolase n=1 Tax=Nocardioides marmoribigeumensis TaxID=433649 RepID=A0ABU2BUV3_9ACTN|nr:amidohydrolase family protein [Nocardioides marmoribigeumensis]MDR7362415.1 cytosine/adenosine deaminase-related metal-dependent hydrolase [Nocardioides marmoribigeumensis]
MSDADQEAPLQRTLIDHLAFALTVDRDDTVLRDASLLVEGTRIVDIGPAEEVRRRLGGRAVDRVVDGRRLGVMPGMIDTHVHLSETLSRAVFPDVLATRAWVFHWAKPFYAHVDEADERVSVTLGAAEMLRSGTTCFLDMGAQNDAGLTATAAGDLGIRGVVGRHAADRKPEVIPPGWSQEMVDHHFFPDHEVALQALEESVRRWNGHADGRIRCWVNIEGKEPCSLELHVGARDLAERLGVGTTYHIASSIEESRVSEKKYGHWPITRVAEAGGLGSNLVLAHAVAVRDDEVDLLARHGASVAFCPSTSLKLAKGATAIGKYPEMIQAGVKVGLGTDGVSAAGNLNLHRQVHLVAGLFKDARLDATLVGARQALRMATIDGAAALGWDDQIGSLEVGKQADLVLFDLDHHEWTPYADPVQAVVWSVSAASIAQTWVAGRPLFAEGRVATVDETALRAEARERAAAIVARAGLGDAVPTTTTLYD